MKKPRVVASFLAFLSLLATAAHADQLEMQNGDRYAGKVLSLNSDTVVLQSDVLGTIKIPRSKIAAMNIGTPLASKPGPTAVAQAPVAKPAAIKPLASTTNSATANSQLSTAIAQLNTQTNLVQQVQDQFLTGADPEVKKKFDELLGGLQTGKVNINDLALQAKSAADQLRSFRKELGPDAGESLDAYLAVLDGFLKETGPPTGSTNLSSTLPKSRPARTTIGDE